MQAATPLERASPPYYRCWEYSANNVFLLALRFRSLEANHVFRLLSLEFSSLVRMHFGASGDDLGLLQLAIWQ
jgi:hypothetical protein